MPQNVPPKDSARNASSMVFARAVFKSRLGSLSSCPLVLLSSCPLVLLSSPSSSVPPQRLGLAASPPRGARGALGGYGASREAASPSIGRPASLRGAQVTPPLVLAQLPPWQVIVTVSHAPFVQVPL